MIEWLLAFFHFFYIATSCSHQKKKFELDRIFETWSNNHVEKKLMSDFRLWSIFQVESDGSRSGSSLSLRNMSGATTNASGGTHPSGGSATGAGTTAGGVTSSSPSHGSTNSGSGSHNRVQRSISATSSKPRRGSTGAQDSNGGGGAGSGGNPPPSAAPRVNNNIQSNFKRQNTVDTATIKENTPRYSGSRPATATATTSKTQQGKIGTAGVLFYFLSLTMLFFLNFWICHKNTYLVIFPVELRLQSIFKT